jgi:hypothetical protein
MSETIPNIESKVAKSFCIVIDAVNKVVPVNRLESINCFYKWLDSYHKLNAFGDEYIQADYYNGHEDDIKNLFLEILALATTDHCFNGNYVLKRLEFLANEGLHMVDIQKDNTNFKVSEKEANEVILNLAKKTKKVSKAQVKKNLKAAYKDYKKTVKSSVDLKPLKKKSVKRDIKGRFTKKK